MDEYINIHIGDETLDDLIDANQDSDIISIVWKIFGNAEITEISDVPVPKQFLQAQRGEIQKHRFFKSLYRTTIKSVRTGLHRPIFPQEAEPVKWVISNGKDIPTEQYPGVLHVQDDYGYEVAQINHYALRSRDGFLIKKARGRANHFKQNIEFDYWKKFDKNDELDDSIVRKFEKCEALKYELFDRNPMLKELHFGGLEQHREKAENLLKDPAFQIIIQRIPRYQQNLKAKQVAVNK